MYIKSHFPQWSHYWPKSLSRALLNFGLDLTSVPQKSSKLHMDVAKTLKKMYVNTSFESEYYTHSYYLDIAFPKEKIGIEVNGPTHYLSGPLNSSKTPECFGRDCLRNAILEKSGWTIISIPFWEWDDLISPEERINYLSDKFKRAQTA